MYANISILPDTDKPLALDFSRLDSALPELIPPKAVLNLRRASLDGCEVSLHLTKEHLSQLLNTIAHALALLDVAVPVQVPLSK